MAIIQPLWNKAVRKEWPTKPRKHIRPSEIGMPFIDRYYSMAGIQPTNPFSERTLRIFDMGNTIEYIVLRALAMAGVLNKKQDWLELPETKEHLGMKGRLDATIGGFVNWDHAKAGILENMAQYNIDLDGALIEGKAMTIIEGLKAQFPNGMPERIVEVKSINSMAFHQSKKNRDDEGNFIGYPHNKMQLMSYLEMSKIQEGLLLYVSKDDFTLAEVPVSRDNDIVRAAFYEDIITMSKYIRAGVTPSPEPEIVYNERKGTFEANWSVSRSLYLTLIYGYKDSDEFQKKNHKRLLDINRALRHLRTSKVKAEDLQVIADYNLEDYIDLVEEEAEEDYTSEE